MSTVYTIEQLVAAGSQFNGNAPALSGSPLLYLDSDGKRVFVDSANDQVEGDAGGLFAFPFVGSSVLWKIDRILLFLNPGTTSYTLTLSEATLPYTPAATQTLQLAAGTGSVLLTDVATLAPTEVLTLVTSGGTGHLAARVTARPLIPLPPNTLG